LLENARSGMNILAGLPTSDVETLRALEDVAVRLRNMEGLLMRRRWI
jgi:hypothetical protein